MKFCEEQAGVDYAIALGTNNQLQLKAGEIIAKAKANFEQRLTPVVELMSTFFSKEEDAC